MKVRFQADADLNEDIVNGVLRRMPEIDFKTANEAELAGLRDFEVLAISASEKRLLVTHDRKTMPRYFAKFIQDNESSGVLLVSQKMTTSAVIEDLILIWLASEAEVYQLYSKFTDIVSVSDFSINRVVYDITSKPPGHDRMGISANTYVKI
jgi:hypothetical protein